MTPSRWTGAMRKAFGYAIQSIDEALSGAESLRMYRDGGGSIRTQDWYTLRRAAVGSIEAADYIGAMHKDAIVPDMARTTIDHKFKGRYKTVGEFFQVDPITGERERNVVSIVTNEVQPLTEEVEQLSALLTKYGYDVSAENVEVGRILFFRRQT